MCQPSNRVSLSGSCTMLNQIILCCSIFANICQYLTYNIQLVITWKNQIFRTLYFSGFFIDLFFYFHKDKLADQIENRILCKNIFPHIGHTVLILKCRISSTCCDSMPVTHVERQEECGLTIKFSGHIHFFQIHSEVYKCSSFESEESRLWISVSTELIDGILIGLTCRITFQLKSHNRQTIQENNYIDSFLVAGPDLLHHRENILAVFLCQFRIKGSRGLGIHELNLLIRKLDTMFQHLNQAASCFRSLRIDEADNRLFQIRLIYFSQIFHCFVLSIF